MKIRSLRLDIRNGERNQNNFNSFEFGGVSDMHCTQMEYIVHKKSIHC